MLRFASHLVAGIWMAHACAGEVVKVSIDDLAFQPADVTVRVGDRVEWVNDDFIDHTATATGGDWDVEIPVGASAGVELTRVGKIDYFCRFHPNMTGTIHVVGDKR
jgi:plastocyanin